MDQQEKENALLEGLALNQKQAIETIYQENYRLIQHLVISNNGSEDDARDVFQEALIVLYEKVRSAHFELNCLLRTYLYSVCRRLWLKKLQQNRRFEIQVTPMEETVPVEEDLEDHVTRNLQFRVMEKALQVVGEPCKSLLEAYYIQKKSMSEIAGDFGYTNSGNAKNQKYKCLVRLKRLFFAQYKNGNADG